MRKLIFGAALLAVLAVPAVSPATSRLHSGVVVRVDAKAKLVAIAAGNGDVMLVHDGALKPRALRPGARVSFSAKTLRNGTLSTAAFTTTGTVRQVHVRGMVLGISAKANAFSLSAHGAVLPVHLAKKARVLSTVGSALPPLDSTQDVTLSFDQTGQASTSSVQQVDPTTDAGAIDGTVTAVTDTTITVSSNGSSITVEIPNWFDPSKLQVGETVLAYFVRRVDGSYAIEGVAADGNEQQADTLADEEGNLQDCESATITDEETPTTSATDATAGQLAADELKLDEAGIAAEVADTESLCESNAVASGQSAAATATACTAEVTQVEQQARQQLRQSESQVSAEVASDPAAEAEVIAEEQTMETDLTTTDQTAEHDAATGTTDNADPSNNNDNNS